MSTPTDVEEQRWHVTRDGQPVSPVLAGEGDCWSWLHRHQPHSVSYATRYGGYRICQLPPGSSA